MVAVDGRRLHIHEMGAGSPTVVLEAGISATSLNWRNIQQQLAAITRVVSYDRAGLGWSDLCEGPRTPSVLARDLRKLLEAAGIPPPYVLVGHSFGGLIVRRYALDYPEQVAGLVLIDSLPPEEWSPLTDENRRKLATAVRLSRRGALLARLGVVRFAVKSLMAGSRWLPKAIGKTASGPGAGVLNRLTREVGKMPREVWPMLAAHWCQPRSFLGMASHLSSLPASAEEMINAAAITGITVVILTAGKKQPVTDDQIRTIAPDARHIVAHASGHWIHLDEPELVISAIQEMIHGSDVYLHPV
jgi:pimeloyl-ACP methyl ester carboxylesterase